MGSLLPGWCCLRWPGHWRLWPNHSRFACQSSPSGGGTGSVTSFGPMTASSFFVHRRITKRSYDL